MESTKKRIRLEFAPLNTAVSVVLVTPNSPLTQVVNTFNSEYEPDRGLTPTVILPQVVANASDGSWPQPQSNQYLADVKWLADGVDITTIAEWAGKFEIGTTGSHKGQLTIKRNLNPGEQISLVFKAKLADERLGVNYPIETDAVILSTSVKSQDQFSISLGDSQIIRYDMFKDRLLEYDYLVAQGRATENASARAACIDENAYIRRIPIMVNRGAQPITTGYTLKYYRVNANLTTTELLATDDEVIELTNDHITLDLRLVEKADYLVKTVVDGREAAQIQFSVNRVYPAFTAEPTNGIAIGPNDRERADTAMVSCDGNIVANPEVMLSMIWMTDTAGKTGVAHNEGERATYQLSSTGIGNDYTNNWLDSYIDAKQKPEFSVATDEDGDVLTDGTDDYIFN